MPGGKATRGGTSGRGRKTRKVKLRATIAHYGREAVLYQDTWDDHILRRHPEVEPYEDLIIEALTDPELIVEGTAGTSSMVFVTDPIGGASFFAEQRIHVPVLLDLSPCLIPTLYLFPGKGRGKVVFRRKK